MYPKHGEKTEIHDALHLPTYIPERPRSSAAPVVDVPRQAAEILVFCLFLVLTWRCPSKLRYGCRRFIHPLCEASPASQLG